MSNISGLSDLRKKEEDESKRQEFYSGGVDNRGGGSGLAVMGPEGSRGGGAPGGGGLFDNIVARAQQPSDLPPPTTGGNSRKITLYRNGFTVDDGPFRDLNSPESRAFIASLEGGNVPAELANGVQGNLDVGLEDRRGEDYVPPPAPAYVAFSGPATTLGSSGSSSQSGAAIFTTDDINQVEVPTLDESKPTTLLQIRTPQGKKIRLKINQDATVLHLASMISRDSGAGGTPDSFILSSGFPPEDIKNRNSTIKDAGLIGAAVTVKAP